MWQRKSFLWGSVFGIWTLFGLLASSQVYYDRAFVGRPVPFVKALAWQMAACYAIALGTPLVLWLAQRYRIESRNWARRITFHILASFVFSTLISVFHIANDMWHVRGVAALTLANFSRHLPVVFDRMVFIYWTILLLSHAYDYYMRYQSGLLRTANLEARLARAELDALKMQLNPHFLFNTLNAIAELIHRNPETADEMVTQLSDMLRTTLEQTGVGEVTLKQELDFLERYLAIERTRMGSRLQIEMHIAPETLDARVPNMLLQPLVENAVKHGIAPTAAGGRITIEASRDNGSLCLNVLDTGRGLPVRVV
jgi:signal transduction histidine kinase